MNDKLITAFHDGCKYDNCECEDDRIQNSEGVDEKSTDEGTSSEDQN
jgi:hypothetical protein